MAIRKYFKPCCRTMISIFILLFGLVVANEDEYRIEKFDHSPGIHFEKIGRLMLTNNNWELITYFDLTHHAQNFKQLEQYYRKTVTLCQHTKLNSVLIEQLIKPLCKRNLFNIREAISKISQERIILEQLVGHEEQQNRTRRGVINLIGRVSKFLFGTMDDEDAEYYNNKIKQSSDNELELTQLIKEQTSVVQATIRNFNNTIGTLAYNENILARNLDQLSKVMEEEVARDIDETRLYNTISEHFSTLSLLLEQYQIDNNNIIEAVLVAKVGILHPLILSPSNFIKELKTISQYISRGLDFPVEINLENAHVLQKVAKLRIFYKQPNLVYIISMPLCQPHVFELLNLTPLPVPIGDNKYLFISPNSRYLAINEIKQHFITLDETQFQSCTEMLKRFYLCQQNSPIYLTHMHNNCEVKLYLPVNRIPENCDKRIIELDSSLYTQLRTANIWLYVVSNSESLTIMCTPDSKTVDVRLKGVGSLWLKSGCKAYGPSTMLYSKFTGNSSLHVQYVPPFHLDVDCEDDIEKFKGNLSSLQLKTKLKLFNFDDLNVAGHRLEEVGKLSEELHEKILHTRSLHSYSFWTYLIGISIIVLVVLMLYCKCCHKFCKRTKCCGMLPGICVTVNNDVSTRRRENPNILEPVIYQRSDELELGHRRIDTNAEESAQPSSSFNSRTICGKILSRRSTKDLTPN